MVHVLAVRLTDATGGFVLPGWEGRENDVVAVRVLLMRPTLVS